MPKYSRFKYSQGYYGPPPAQLGYSVEPMSAFVYRYGENDGKIDVSFTTPQGAIKQFRIVRNQEYYPETAEDGVIIYDYLVQDTESVPVVTVFDTTYSDAYPAFVTGKYVYYRAWIRKSDNAWYSAGSTYALVPNAHPTKTSRNTSRSSIEEGVTFEVTSVEISDGVATIHLAEDVTTDSTTYAFESYIRVGSDIRLYGLGSQFSGINTVTAVAPYSFSYETDSADLELTYVSGKVSLWPLEEAGEENHSQSEYSDLELLSTHDKMMDLLPRVYTSTAQSPLDEVDTSSFLYRFMGAFAATFDETMTYADLLRPQANVVAASPTTLPLAANMYGLPVESQFAYKSQKRMVRDARKTFGAKGTQAALEMVAENVTGYAPSVVTSENLLLSVQDSSFYKGIGFWKPSTGATIAAVNMVEEYPLIGVPTASEAAAIDLSWAAEVVTSATNKTITNGADNVLTKGIPVQPGIEYTFSYYAKGTGNITAAITWYDFLGQEITTNTASPVSFSGSWAKSATATFTAPAAGDVISGNEIPYDAAFASLSLKFASAGTYYVDMVSFANSAIETYEEARATNIFLYPTKYNLINNPSFEAYSGGAFGDWSKTAGTVSQVASTLTLAYGGTNMLSWDTDTGANTLSTVTDTGIAFSNNFYTFSVYAKTSSGTESVTLTLSVDDTILDPISHTSETFTLTDQWQRVFVTLKVPSTINSSLAALTASITLTDSSGGVIYLDDAQLELGYRPSDYFDGNIGYAQGGFWNDSTNASASYLYANIMDKMPRLIAALPDYIPMNTPYTISTEYRTEYKTILL